MDDLLRKDEDDPIAVLRAIRECGGRYSAFDATRTQKMARTMQWLETESGWVKRKGKQPVYPWIIVELTDTGRAVLARTEVKR